MRKALSFTWLILLSLIGLQQTSLQAQNVQLHYDMGKHVYSSDYSARPALTTTVEMFKPDRFGSSFFFVDMNYQAKGIASAYWEIARDIRLWKAPVSLHLEYNGGLSNQFSYNDAYLVGASYAYNEASYRWGITLTPMYKHLAGQGKPHSAQLTAVWYWHLAKGLVSLTGFADLWGDRNFNSENMTVFLTEPQIWVNLNKLKGVPEDFNLSVGGEVEMSYNFPVQNSKFYAIPTLALKWTF